MHDVVPHYLAKVPQAMMCLFECRLPIQAPTLNRLIILSTVYLAGLSPEAEMSPRTSHAFARK